MDDLEVCEFEWSHYNYRRASPPSSSKAYIKLAVGEQYRIQVDGQKCIRVLLLALPELDENGECRGLVVVLEKNAYVRCGALCRPLAFTFSECKA